MPSSFLRAAAGLMAGSPLRRFQSRNTIWFLLQRLRVGRRFGAFYPIIKTQKPGKRKLPGLGDAFRKARLTVSEILWQP